MPPLLCLLLEAPHARRCCRPPCHIHADSCITIGTFTTVRPPHQVLLCSFAHQLDYAISMLTNKLSSPVRACAPLAVECAPCMSPPPLPTTLRARALAPALLPARPSDHVCACVPLPAERAVPGCTCEDSILSAGLCAQAHTSALGLLVLLARLAAPVSAAGTFTTKAELQAALELVVCDGDADALALYGAPDTWDVSAVTDMSYLIGARYYDSYAGLSCKATFNEVHP